MVERLENVRDGPGATLPLLPEENEGIGAEGTDGVVSNRAGAAARGRTGGHRYSRSSLLDVDVTVFKVRCSFHTTRAEAQRREQARRWRAQERHGRVSPASALRGPGTRDDEHLLARG